METHPFIYKSPTVLQCQILETPTFKFIFMRYESFEVKQLILLWQEIFINGLTSWKVSKKSCDLHGDW